MSVTGLLSGNADKSGKSDVTAAVLKAAQKDDLTFPKGRYLFDPPNRDADGLARVTLTAAFCALQRGAVLVTAGPHVRVTINAPFEVQNQFRQCFDVSQGGYFLVGPRGRVDAFTSDMFGAYGDGTLSTEALQGLVAACIGAPEARNGVNRCYLNREGAIGPGQFALYGTVLDGELASGHLHGDSILATVLVQTKPNTPIFKTNSCAYSKITRMILRAGADQDGSTALFDCDYAYHASTAALQFNKFEELEFDGADRADNGLWYGRSGLMGSETDISRCRFRGFRHAAYRQDSWNALNNVVTRCNFADNRRNSVEINLGNCHVLFNAFQNQGDGTTAYQIDTDGWDIYIGSGGEASCIYGNRTEWLRHFWASPYSLIDCRASVGRPAVKRWAADTVFPLGTLLSGNDGHGDGMLYKLVQSSGDGKTSATEPAWLGHGTYEGGVPGRVTDGDCVWEHVEFDVVSARAGSCTDCIFPLGRIDCASSNLPLKLENIVASRVDWMPWQAYALGESSHRYLAVHVLKGALGAATHAPLTPYRPTEIGADKDSCCRSRVLNFGSYSVLFSEGSAGHVKPDVGIERAQDQLTTIGSQS